MIRCDEFCPTNCLDPISIPKPVRPTRAQILELATKQLDLIPTFTTLLANQRQQIEHLNSTINELYSFAQTLTEPEQWQIEWALERHLREISETNKKISKLCYLLSLADGSSSHSEELDLSTAKETPIQDLYEFSFKKNTTNRIHTNCPFHEEKTPSFVIYLDSNSFYCFGCNEGGDVIDFVQKLHNVSFKEALKYLCN